jgi:hypothetical protein
MQPSIPEMNMLISEFMHQGDILLSEDQVDAKTPSNGGRVKRKALNQTGSKWPVSGVGVINYTFDPAANFSKTSIFQGP